MRIYYFVHVSGTDPGISGVPRVVKSLGRELKARGDVELVPVRWCERRRAIVHAEKELLDNLARFSGPELVPHEEVGHPIRVRQDEWILFAEVPHLESRNPRYPSVSIGEPIGYARQQGLRVAVVFHDILPLTHAGALVVLGRSNALTPPTLLGGDDPPSEAIRLRFALYAQALLNADLVIPVSWTTGHLLSDWLVENGALPQQLPLLAPVPLPEEVIGLERKPASRAALAASEGKPVEFIAVGTICARKNQLTAMLAFNRASARRPDLKLLLHVVGSVEPDCSVPASLLARQSNGKIVLHGNASDDELRLLTVRSRASVFISLAEGFGLPVAESLWQGKPSICSNTGAVAEVAAQGGGCVLVDPTDVEEVARAIEGLAEDTALNNRLIDEIEARPLRTWADYTQDIMSKLTKISAAVDEDAPELAASIQAIERSAHLPDLRRRRSLIGRYVPPRFFIVTANDLIVNEEYSDSDLSSPLRMFSAIRYSKLLHGDVKSDLLFQTSSIPLRAGEYDLHFDGKVDGELALSALADGQKLLATRVLTGFDEPFSFTVKESVEVLAQRTKGLESMTLRSLLIEFRGRKDDILENLIEPGNGSIVRDKAGLPLGERFNLPADKFSTPAESPIRNNSSIYFDARQHSSISGDLFYGPYLRLPPGRYTFVLRGTLKGTLKLKLATGVGKNVLRSLTVNKFGTPITVDIPESVEDFEIVGSRTNGTRALSLSGVEVARDTLPAEPAEPASRWTRWRGHRSA